MSKKPTAQAGRASGEVSLENLDYDEILDILDEYEDADEGAPEHPAVNRVAELVAHYSSIAGEELKQGRDYLPLLTPKDDTAPIEVIAMEIVLEILEEELESAE